MCQYCRMISTINLVNICHHLLVTFFFLALRTFKIYLLSNFQIWNILLLAIVTMLYLTSPGLIYFFIGSMYLSTPFIHFAPPPTIQFKNISITP